MKINTCKQAIIQQNTSQCIASIQVSPLSDRGSPLCSHLSSESLVESGVINIPLPLPAQMHKCTNAPKGCTVHPHHMYIHTYRDIPTLHVISGQHIHTLSIRPRSKPCKITHSHSFYAPQSSVFEVKPRKPGMSLLFTSHGLQNIDDRRPRRYRYLCTPSDIPHGAQERRGHFDSPAGTTWWDRD